MKACNYFDPEMKEQLSQWLIVAKMVTSLSILRSIIVSSGITVGDTARSGK